MKITTSLTSTGFELKTQAIDYKQFTLICGHNDTGKSFINKAVWYTQHVFSVYQLLGMLGIKNTDEEIELYINKTFGWTFSDPNQVSGSILIQGDYADLRLNMDEGKLSSFDLDITDSTNFTMNTLPRALYNTKNARLFTQYDQYNNTKKAMGLGAVSTLDDMEKICSIYKLYDVIWFEFMSVSLNYMEKNGLGIVKPALESICSTFNSEEENARRNINPEDFFVKDSKIYINQNGVEKSINQYSDGFQAYSMQAIFLAIQAAGL